MSVNTIKVPNGANKYECFDKADAEMIEKAEQGLRAGKVIQTEDKTGYTISWEGLKDLTLEQAEKKESFKIVKSGVECNHNESKDPKDWMWEAYCVLQNNKTKLDTRGDCERPYLGFDNKKDKFARRACMTMAERNATRKQIPTVVIETYVQRILAEQKVKLGTDDKPSDGSTCKSRHSEAERKKLEDSYEGGFVRRKDEIPA